jgi:phospholipase/carboxylesterase
MTPLRFIDYKSSSNDGWTAKSLVIFFHGFGADKQDLMSLARTWATHLPHTLFISLDAPHMLSGERHAGRFWFTIDPFDLKHISQEMRSLYPDVCETIRSLQKQYHIPPHKVALVGFSQGAAVALSVGLYQIPVAGVLGYSGFLIPPSDAGIPNFPPICLIHGDQDQIIPLHYLKDAQAFLKAHQVPFEMWISEGLGHGISPFGLEKGRLFLQKVLHSSAPQR